MEHQLHIGVDILFFNFAILIKWYYLIDLILYHQYIQTNKEKKKRGMVLNQMKKREEMIDNVLFQYQYRVIFFKCI